MKIEQFIARSTGEWKSMRSSHSLAFQQFEEITSIIKIYPLELDSPDVRSTLKRYSKEDIQGEVTKPFKISWKSESNWDENEKVLSGSSVLIPIKSSEKDGVMLRSIGYAERVQSISNYGFLDDGTFTLKTEYDYTIAEERIWFVSENVRCRSSAVRSLKNNAIMQLSFASEIRKINLNDENKTI